MGRGQGRWQRRRARAVDWHVQLAADPVMFREDAEITVVAPVTVTGSDAHRNPPLRMVIDFLMVEEEGTLKVTGHWVARFPD